MYASKRSVTALRKIRGLTRTAREVPKGWRCHQDLCADLGVFDRLVCGELLSVACKF
jgi:hypothetical protein